MATLAYHAKAMHDYELLPVLRAAQRCLARAPNDMATLDGQSYPTGDWIAALQAEAAKRGVAPILSDGWQIH